MFSRVFSADIYGVDAHLICVEADVAGGLPQFNMVGLLSSEVKEAKERVIRAFSNSGVDLPARRITVNLSPAGVRKQGSGFDMPIAVAILAAFGIIRQEELADKVFIGELSLDGRFNKVRGILPAALMAKELGYKSIVVPLQNAYEGAVVDGITVYGVADLADLIRRLNERTLQGTEPVILENELQKAYEAPAVDYTEISGQEQAKRATLVAVAGFHNLLYVGPPGSGKSMMAQRIPTILGRLTAEECLEISKIYSIMGMLPEHSVMLQRPFRDPHHSITGPALIGGMNKAKPGEVTLAHRGVLFLDEAGEFRKDVIEALRIPLENKTAVISRLSGNVVFPADFMLVMAMNPCPCGYYPDRNLCQCSMQEVKRYFGKIRGPVLDRIDICVGTSKLKIRELDQAGTYSSAWMREKVRLAQEIQISRFREEGIRFNSQMNGRQIEKYCILGTKEKELLDKAYQKYNLSARGYHKVMKVARTIADLEQAEAIGSAHIIEAIGYRNTYEYRGGSEARF